MSRPATLVLNASDFAGNRLSRPCWAQVVASLRATRFSRMRRGLRLSARLTPVREILGGSGPEEWVAEAWRLAGRVDALISNDHFPAVQTATESADVEALRATLEALVVAPFGRSVRPSRF